MQDQSMTSPEVIELYRRFGEASVKKWPEGVVGSMRCTGLQHSHVALLKVMA